MGRPTVEERGTSRRAIEQPPFDAIETALAIRDSVDRLEALNAVIAKLDASQAADVERRLFEGREKDPLYARFHQFSTGTQNAVRKKLEAIIIAASAWGIAEEDKRIKALLEAVPTLERDDAQDILQTIRKKNKRDWTYVEFKKLTAKNEARLVAALKECTKPLPEVARDESDEDEPSREELDAEAAEDEREYQELQKRKDEYYLAQHEQFERLVAIDPREYTVGLFKHGTAPLEPVARKLMWLANLAESIMAFFEGLFDGVAAELNIDPLDMLEMLGKHFYQVPFVYHSFSKGVAKGIFYDAKNLVKEVIDLLVSPWEFAKTLASVFETLITDSGKNVCRKVGYAMGGQMAKEISDAVHGDLDNFAETCGRTIGPPIVYIVLGAMGVPVGAPKLLEAAIQVLKRSKAAKKILKKLEALYERKNVRRATVKKRHARGTDDRGVPETKPKEKKPRKEKAKEKKPNEKKQKKTKEEKALERRLKNKDKLRGLLMKKKAKPASKSKAIIGRGDRAKHRRAVADKASEKGHPLDFLIDRDRWEDGDPPPLFTTTEKGLTQDRLFHEPQRIESGHTTSDWIGGNQMVVMTAWRNRIYSGTIEAARKAAIDSVPRALDIGGIAVELESALDMYVKGLLKEKALKKATLLDLTK